MKFPLISRVLLGAALCACTVSVAPTAVHAQRTCSTTNDVFENPFNRQSAHHLPIGTNARYADNNHPATRDWLKASRFNINVGGPWGVDVAAVTGSDPMVRVNSRVIGPDGGYGLPVTIRVPKDGFKTRVSTNQSGNTDGVAVIYDRSNGQTHQLRQYNWNNGSPTAAQYRNWNIRGLGHGTRNGERIGTSASGVAALFGVLRGSEINRAGHPIEHALQMVLPRTKPNECNVMLSRQMILPATTRDSTADRPENNRGNIRYGELLALPPSVNINSLGLSEPGKRLAEAIRNYGIRVVDGGGCAAGAIRSDQHVNSQVINQLKSDIPKIYRHIRVVTNGEWQSGMTAVGGGQPLAANCAYDASASQQSVSTPASSSAGSTAESGSSGSPSTNQSQQPSAANEGSRDGSVAWGAVPQATNYYVEIRDMTKARTKVLGRMVPPKDGGCVGGGTCRFNYSALPADKSYQWSFRATVNGKPQAFSKWQPISSSSASTSASAPAAAEPSTVASAPQSQSSGSSSGGGGTFRVTWGAVHKANNYYVEVRDTSSQRTKVHGRMAPPNASGCANGGTCQHVVPALPASQSYEWTWRPVVDGTPRPFQGWRPLR